MPTKIGQFEVLSELSKSAHGLIYKANDSENGQTIALKAIQLSAFGEHAAELAKALLAEAEAAKVLSSPNITKVYGAGEIEGQFCAAMEYIQGNSVATMLARKEGFSIWDLLDIGRQLCGGLDHAKSHNIVHYSLEPAKIMCGWDGTVKILGYGISSVGNFVQHLAGEVSPVQYYMSPEQVKGEATDSRSNLFTLGAMLYEMVTERKAFDREDVESLRQSIIDSTPTAPLHVNPKVHPLLSDLIMKALAKDPADRFQNGRELLDELEKCKESRPAKKAEAAKPATVVKPSADAQAKFIGTKAAAPVAPKPAAPKPEAPKPVVAENNVAARPVSAPVETKPAAPPKPVAPPAAAEAKPSKLAKPASRLAMPKASAAAAGADSATTSPSVSFDAPSAGSKSYKSSSDFDGPSAQATVDAPTVEAPEAPAPQMSAATDELELETFEPAATEDGPKIAVDPMMAEGPAKSSGTSFSEMTELPPLKEVYVAPAPPPPAAAEPAPAPVRTLYNASRKDEKPKVQPREVAEKAIKEIKGVPPKLMMYAIGGALALILVIGIGVTVYIHSLGSDDDAGAARATAPAETTTQPDTTTDAAAKKDQAAAPAPAPAAPVAAQPAETQPAAAEPEEAAPTASAKGRNGKKKATASPAIIPGQLAIDSTPQGAQVQVDGAAGAGYVTPFTLTNVQPGQHTITVSKPGYGSDSRTITVTAGNRATATVHLTQLMATLVVRSDPAGASVYVDGKDVGVKTPAQVSLDKGQHVVLVRMSGYLDETMNGQFTLGQTSNFSPTLRALGNTDSIHTVGKMSKLFGHKGDNPGQGTVSIHTQPKGAQIAINQHMLDKNSPVDVMLDPGNYEVDITMSGYAPLHKVINVDKGGKAVVDEVLQKQ